MKSLHIDRGSRQQVAAVLTPAEYPTNGAHLGVNQ
jgi:hypothetical protein